MSNFYVYAHYKSSDLFPFYIGKGIGKRAFEKHGRTKHWKNIVNKYGYRIEIMYENLSEEMAHAIECALIKHYGRSNIGCGSLINITEGGEGTIGLKHTEETKKIISEKNKKWERTPEYCRQISEARLGKKRAPFSESARKNMSESKRGTKNHRFGKKLSEQVRKNISDGRRRQIEQTRATHKKDI